MPPLLVDSTVNLTGWPSPFSVATHAAEASCHANDAGYTPPVSSRARPLRLTCVARSPPQHAHPSHKVPDILSA
eukprot:scaffold189136_cov31-Tisochrysis_lutea.AAC.1